MGHVLAIGTMKGAWIARSDDRVSWDLEGPLLKGWEVNTFGRAPDGTWLATTGSCWFGAAVHRSDDLSDWTQVVDGPSYEGAPDDRKLERIWTLAAAGGVLFAGVAEAGLFRSADRRYVVGAGDRVQRAPHPLRLAAGVRWAGRPPHPHRP